MILGIVGGMGPAATCDLFRKITELTHATKDQEHIHIVIDSNTQIPDRSKYICGLGEDPKVEMIRSITRLEMMGANYIVIPCNTAHYFYDEISPYTKVPILHMINETAVFLKKTYPKIQDFMLLAAEGTYKAEVYKSAFRKYDLNIVEPDQSDKKTIMDWIYKVKAGNFCIDPVEFNSLINRYIVSNSVPIILGCTELPLLVEKISVLKEYIDPTSILAQCCVEIAEGRKELLEKYGVVCGDKL